MVGVVGVEVSVNGDVFDDIVGFSGNIVEDVAFSDKSVGEVFWAVASDVVEGVVPVDDGIKDNFIGVGIIGFVGDVVSVVGVEGFVDFVSAGVVEGNVSIGEGFGNNDEGDIDGVVIIGIVDVAVEYLVPLINNGTDGIVSVSIGVGEAVGIVSVGVVGGKVPDDDGVDEDVGVVGIVGIVGVAVGLSNITGVGVVGFVGDIVFVDGVEEFVDFVSASVVEGKVPVGEGFEYNDEGDTDGVVVGIDGVFGGTIALS